MLKSLTLAILLLCFQVAQAESLHPCTPTVQAKPTYMTCHQEFSVGYNNGAEKIERIHYQIVINTLMSPPQCTGDNHYEIKSAKIKVYNSKVDLASLDLKNGSFTYKLSGQASFTAPLLGLDLKNCVVPMDGGFSVGN